MSRRLPLYHNHKWILASKVGLEIFRSKCRVAKLSSEKCAYLTSQVTVGVQVFFPRPSRSSRKLMTKQSLLIGKTWNKKKRESLAAVRDLDAEPEMSLRCSSFTPLSKSVLFFSALAWQAEAGNAKNSRCTFYFCFLWVNNAVGYWESLGNVLSVIQMNPGGWARAWPSIMLTIQFV